jgi:hypothetical protein
MGRVKKPETLKELPLMKVWEGIGTIKIPKYE